MSLRCCGPVLWWPHGGEPPKAVGVLADKGIESYVGLLAGLYTGATVVPLHAEFPAQRTKYMLEASGVTTVLADAHGLATLAETDVAGPELSVLAPRAKGVGTGRFREIGVDTGLALDGPRQVKETDTALVLFTSGSTGRPKGVPITHGSTDHYFRVLDGRYDFHQDDVFSQTFDLNFDCAMFDLFCAWGAGASVHAVPPQAYRDMPGFFAERGMTVWFSTPSGISLIRRMGGLAPASMPGLRWSFFMRRGTAGGRRHRLAGSRPWFHRGEHLRPHGAHDHRHRAPVVADGLTGPVRQRPGAHRVGARGPRSPAPHRGGGDIRHRG